MPFDPTKTTELSRSVDIDAMAKVPVPSVLISADSHIGEPPDAFKVLPASVRDRTPFFVGQNRRPDGAFDPGLRVKDMDKDGVQAEVMYPDRVLGVFAAEQDIQEAVLPVYNDWLAEYCSASPKRLFGITALPAYDIDKAIKELERGVKKGLKGGLLWEVPHRDLPFTSPHYEKLWAAAAEMGEPINLHILTGFNYQTKGNGKGSGMEKIRGAVNHKTADAVNALFDFLWSGIFDRHPKLKLGLIESEIGWIPFMLQMWDYYFHRARNQGHGLTELAIQRPPSEIFAQHVYATFMDDYTGSRLLPYWGENNVMWSSDYPHPNMTWPNSKSFVARQIGELPMAVQEKLVSKNVIDLYKLNV